MLRSRLALSSVPLSFTRTHALRFFVSLDRGYMKSVGIVHRCRTGSNTSTIASFNHWSREGVGITRVRGPARRQPPSPSPCRPHHHHPRLAASAARTLTHAHLRAHAHARVCVCVGAGGGGGVRQTTYIYLARLRLSPSRTHARRGLGGRGGWGGVRSRRATEGRRCGWRDRDGAAMAYDSPGGGAGRGTSLREREGERE